MAKEQQIYERFAQHGGHKGIHRYRGAFSSTFYEMMPGAGRPFMGLSGEEISDQYVRGIFLNTSWLGSIGAIITKCWLGQYGECNL